MKKILTATQRRDVLQAFKEWREYGPPERGRTFTDRTKTVRDSARALRLVRDLWELVLCKPARERVDYKKGVSFSARALRDLRLGPSDSAFRGVWHYRNLSRFALGVWLAARDLRALRATGRKA